MAIIKSIKKFANKIKKMTSFDLKKAGQKSREWLKKTLGKAFNTTSKEPKNWVHKDLKDADLEFQESISPTQNLQIGHMGFFTYDPKWKKALPYYDTFPLIIVVSPAKGGFLGLNMHYLPYLLRAKLMDDLLSIKAYTVYNGKKDAEFQSISYDYLKGMSTSNLIKPTIKHYLYGHVKSKFARVHSNFWEEALFLPVEQFKKASKREVWADSRGMV